MKKFFLTLILAAFCGMSSAFAYDFSAVCPTGQTLYYNIIDAVNHEVEIVCPDEDEYWSWFEKPSGYIELPTSVECDGINYAVISIGNYAFKDCWSLTGDLVIPNSIVSIGDFAFNASYDNADNLVIGNSVISIGKYAFYNTWFSGSLTIGNSVTSIGKGAFFVCNFTGDLVIPNSVVEIGDEAFCSCSGFHGNLVIGNSVSSIGKGAFSSCDFTGDLVIPESVITIGDDAFLGCDHFSGDITIPNSVITIGQGAFADGYGFTGDIVIGNSVTEIGDYAFANNFGITGNLVIGNSMTEIGVHAFESCSDLSNIIVYCDNPPTIGLDAFTWFNNTIPVYIPCGSMQAYQTAEGWNQFTNYRQMPYYEFTTESGNENGRVVILQEPDCETEGIVEAIPDEGFDFLGWSTIDGEIISIENPYSFTLTEDLHLLAYFGWNDGIDDNELMKISVYPNPTSGLFIVEGEDILKIEVYHAMGQLIYTKTASDYHTEIDLGNAADGMFLVRVTGKDWTAERNVVKR